MTSLFSSSQQLVVRSKRGSPITQTACQVFIREDVIATMTGSFWKRDGAIVMGDTTFPISAGVLRFDNHHVISSEVVEPFLRRPYVELLDSLSVQVFQVRPTTFWSGHFAIHLDTLVVAEFVPTFLQTKTSVNVLQDTPKAVVLFSVWLITINLCFSA